MEIDLDDLRAHRGAGIGEFHGQFDDILRRHFRRLSEEVAKSKVGVGQAESEGEERENLVLIVMAVSYIKALIVVDIDFRERFWGMIWVPQLIFKGLEIIVLEGGVGAARGMRRGMDGGILEAPGKGDRQFPGRAHIPAEDICNGVSPFLVGLPNAQQARNLVEPRVHQARAAAEKNDDRLRVLLSDPQDRPSQLRLEREGVSVLAFAIIKKPVGPAGDDKDQVGVFRVFNELHFPLQFLPECTPYRGIGGRHHGGASAPG